MTDEEFRDTFHRFELRLERLDTNKKTSVVATLDVDLIERDAREEEQELKDVVNLAFHEFFARRRYLSVEE
jgi:hypothetical protein